MNSRLSFLLLIMSIQFLGFSPTFAFSASISYAEKPLPLNKSFSHYMTCVYKDLSHKYDFHLKFFRVRENKDDYEKIVFKVVILNKISSRIVDSISATTFCSLHFFDNCMNARSFITGASKDRAVIDGDHGDIVVADFNFDSREDIAIVNDCMSNAGRRYNFYLQDRNGRFYIDSYLTDKVSFFPEINNEERTLVRWLRNGVCGSREDTYRFDIENGVWRRISYKFSDWCDGFE